MPHDLGEIRRRVHARVQEEEAEYGTGPGAEAPGKGEVRGLRLLGISELLSNPRPTDWLIRDYLDKGALACLFGASGTMKSFVALDLGLCVAAGRPWHGCSVKPGPVIYVAGEGFGGLSKRIKAWTRQHDVSDSIPFYVSDRAVAVLDPESLAEAHTAIDGLVEQVGNPVLIVVDTVARNFGPGDENSTRDMSAFVAGLDKIKTRYGCAVLAVHHSGLTAQERGRGSYALHAGLDWEFRLGVQGDIRVLSCTKPKDFEFPPDVAFAPEIVPTGWADPETGADITSVVLNRTDLPGRKERGLSGAKRIALEALRACCEENGQAHIKKWRIEAYERGITPSEEPDAKKKAFRRAVDQLRDMGLVETASDFWWPTEGDKGDNRGTCPPCPGGHQGGTKGTCVLDMSLMSPCPDPSRVPDREDKEGGDV